MGYISFYQANNSVGSRGPHCQRRLLIKITAVCVYICAWPNPRPFVATANKWGDGAQKSLGQDEVVKFLNRKVDICLIFEKCNIQLSTGKLAAVFYSRSATFFLHMNVKLGRKRNVAIIHFEWILNPRHWVNSTRDKLQSTCWRGCYENTHFSC